MKSPPWKTLGELVGIAALVTSLVFVGYQLKQDRQVATMQVRADWIERNAGLYAEINQHAEVLARANSGAELSESEAITVRNLVGTAFDIVLSIRSPEDLQRSRERGANELWARINKYLLRLDELKP
jgi:hypothetical protein